MTMNPRTRSATRAGSSVRVHITTLSAGIRATPEFAKKGLASFAVNVGTKCGHACTYCSTGTMLRMHPSFRAAGENPFEHDYAIVDPKTPERVARDASRIRTRGLVQLCTTVDAWAPEAQQHDLGRRCLEALLRQPGWEVRILTKNAAVAKDFDLIAAHGDRVRVGLSFTAVPSKQKIISVIEPHASTIAERIATLKKAHASGLRTYAMLCPLLPGIADDQDSVRELVRIGIGFGAEEFFVEPVNGRGRGLLQTTEALEQAGFKAEADAVRAVRQARAWSTYVRRLLATVQAELYPTRLTDGDLAWIRTHNQGVKWLG
jgi:DNA repair photolyase